MASLKSWRKWHRNILGYFRWLTIFSVILIVFISITGILLEHKNEFRFMQTVRVPTTILPQQYEDRLATTREAQKMDISEAAVETVPLNWVVYDLHAGTFFGRWAIYYYDLIALALMVLSITGVWMFIIVTKKRSRR